MTPEEQVELTLVQRLTRAEFVFLKLWYARRRTLPKLAATALAFDVTAIAYSSAYAAPPATHFLFAIKLSFGVGGLLLVASMIIVALIIIRTSAPKEDIAVSFAGDVVSIRQADGTALSLPKNETKLYHSRLGVIVALGPRIVFLLPFRVLTDRRLAFLVKYYGLVQKEVASLRPGHLSPRTGLTLIGGSCCFAVAVCVVIAKPWQSFEAAFDANLTYSAPFDAALVIADPTLHEHLLRFTAAAYEKGGWPAASATLKMIMISDVLPYASDDQVLAYEQAKLHLALKLTNDPEKCLRYTIDGGDEGTFQGAEAEVNALNDATWKAVQAGLERKRQGVVWHAPTPEQVDKLWRTIEFGRYPLSQREISLLTYARTYHVDPTRFPNSMICSASIKSEENILAFIPVSDAAFAARIMMSEMNQIAHAPHVETAHADTK